MVFLNYINKDKFNDFRKINVKECLFCNREKFVNIIDKSGLFILLKNKYFILEDIY